VNRALRAATLGVLVLSPVALSACSAGQVTQTATQERDKTGSLAQVGSITIRQGELTYPRGGAYDQGDDAELVMTVINSGLEDDVLVDISGDGFGDVEIRGSTSGTAPSSPAAGSAGGTSARSTEVEIPADSTTFIGGEDGELTVTLTDLEQPLTTGQYIGLTLIFENAGEISLPVTVANPERSLDRGERFDYHEGEGH
jgi:copper(I)-binding protein